MDKFKKIEYIDAKYIYSDSDFETLNLKLDKHTAFGYISTNKTGDYIVEYIKKIINNKTKESDLLIEGLILPNGAVTDEVKFLDTRNYGQIDNNIEIFWDDVVHVINNNRYDVSKMHTTGVLVYSNEDFIVIKNPITIRVYPEPTKKHPEKDSNYYMIPKSFIKEIILK